MIQKQNNQYAMIYSILKNRQWIKKYCFFKRNCYLTGKNLQFKICYVGRRKINNIANHNYNNDDIWISKNEYQNIITFNVV